MASTGYEPFSDASSSYWPDGWDWARYSNPEADYSLLPDEELAKLRAGLLEVLGDEGLARMSIHLRQKERLWEDQKLREQGVPPPAYNPPDFLKRWEERHRGRPWGFVAFRTALYGDDERWAEFERRLRPILHVAFDRVVEAHRGHEYPAVAEARSSFELHWIQDAELDGAFAETLRARYARLKQDGDTPAGMRHDVFLCASPEAVESVLCVDDNRLPATQSSYWRDDAPFLLVVMEEAAVNPHGEDEEDEHDPTDANDERNWYKSVFKAPVEIIPDHLWDLIDRSFLSPTMLTRGVKGSTELGGAMPENDTADGLTELWWGMMPSPKALKRRRLLRGLPG
ncbi:hypothetical protein CDD83_4272 [Cordyceps sp. RAO-2017]|nr:hypothetical protein CDD83_4272 [Cordyceps sp. RAO-2017]